MREMGMGCRKESEEDYLKHGNVTGHYRFDASQLERSILVQWED